MSQVVLSVGFKEVMGIAGLFLTALVGFGKVLLWQFQKLSDERAAHQGKYLQRLEDTTADLVEGVEKRIEAALDAHLRINETRMRNVEEAQRIQQQHVTTLGSELQALHNGLALRYVQREDFIRFATSIDHKIDRLGELFTRFTIRGIPHE